VKGWVRLISVAILAVGLALACMVEADGNPLTQDFPNVVLVAGSVNDQETCREDSVTDPAQDRVRARTPRVLVLHRARRRWATILRRWHRSFLADVPV
jgi:hypothetical protein